LNVLGVLLFTKQSLRRFVEAFGNMFEGILGAILGAAKLILGADEVLRTADWSGELPTFEERTSPSTDKDGSSKNAWKIRNVGEGPSAQGMITNNREERSLPSPMVQFRVRHTN